MVVFHHGEFMGKLGFTLWALGRILWLAFVVVFSMVYPLLLLYFLLQWAEKHWHKDAKTLWSDFRNHVKRMIRRSRE